MWGRPTARLDPDRSTDQRRWHTGRARGDSSRNRRHRPGLECLEDRRLLSAITEFPLATADTYTSNLTVGPDGNLWFPDNSAGVGAIGRITPAGAIAEFPLPAGTGSSFAGSLTVGPDGNLWFQVQQMVGPGANEIGRITPAGVITEFPSPAGADVESNLTAGPDGNLWFYLRSLGSGVNAIGQITPAGVITEFPLPAGAAVEGNLTVGPDGSLWFPEGLPESPPVFSSPIEIGRITTAGVITEFPVNATGSPSDLTVGPDGNLWFSDAATGLSEIDRITPTGVIAEFPLPAGASIDAQDSLTVGPDGNLWFPDASGSLASIGRITPTGAITEFPLAAGTDVPGTLTVAPDGNLWFYAVQSAGGAAIGRITPAGAVTEFPDPDATSSSAGLTVGPDGNLWFYAQQSTGGAAIGRLDPTPPSVTGAVEVAHSRKAITSITLTFNEALDPGSAESGALFSLASEVKRGHKIVFSKRVKIGRVSYDGTAYTVQLKLARPQKKTLMVTVGAGIVAADGILSLSDFTAVVK
jgi:virginiamycin B lyase